MAVHVFVDESARGKYLLAAAILATERLASVRAAMQALRLPGERRLHFQSERNSRRREVLVSLVRMDIQVQLYTGRGKNERVRRACLRQLVIDAVKLDARRVVLESRDVTLDRIDRRTIADALRVASPAATGADWPAYDHLRPYEDPALWIPDAVAWCHGAGGDWQRRMASLTSAVIDLGDL